MERATAQEINVRDLHIQWMDGEADNLPETLESSSIPELQVQALQARRKFRPSTRLPNPLANSMLDLRDRDGPRQSHETTYRPRKSN